MNHGWDCSLTKAKGSDANHYLYWGRMYNPKDVKIEWHGEVPF